jgi:hypothetical protein
MKETNPEARHLWFMPVILTTWQTEIRRTTDAGQPEQKSSWDSPHLYGKNLDGVACACHPSKKCKIGGLLWGWLGQKAIPFLQNNQSEKGCRHSSSDRAPAYQAWSPEIKLQYSEKKKKKQKPGQRTNENFWEDRQSGRGVSTTEIQPRPPWVQFCPMI